MNQTGIAILAVIALSSLGVIGDYFLKVASNDEISLKTSWFFIGLLILASTAFGWVYVMKHIKLATLGVVYSVSTVLLLAFVGVILYQESLNPYESGGKVLSIASLILLSAFS